MISVTPTEFVFIYLLVFLIGIFGIWIIYEFARKRRRNANLSRRIQCRLCGMEFENYDDTEKIEHDDAKVNAPLPCPRCGALTERTSRQSFI
ncbi:MAG: hypothetical protein ACK5LK_10265 [Chthoniobacterales bacterium]